MPLQSRYLVFPSCRNLYRKQALELTAEDYVKALTEVYKVYRVKAAKIISINSKATKTSVKAASNSSVRLEALQIVLKGKDYYKTKQVIIKVVVLGYQD